MRMTNVERLRSDLRAVKEDLLQYGWMQSDLGHDGGPRCIIGACHSVMSGTVSPGRLSRSKQERCEALADVLEPLMFPWRMSSWNDEPTRTFDEVIALLDAALAALPVEVSEPESVPVQIGGGS